MDCFDKHMALDVIEDALSELDTPNGRGMATGLCGAFYMCGLLSPEEWEGFLKRIPAEHYKFKTGGIFEVNDAEIRDAEIRLGDRALNIPPA